MSKFFKAAAAALFLCLLLASPIYAQESNLAAKINQHRLQQSLPPLTQSQLLKRSAHNRACDIKQTGSFSHTDSNGQGFQFWIKKTGYDFVYAGENLAKNFTSDEQLLAAWIDSPSHQKILLSEKYTEIGIGRCGQYVVAHFGRKRASAWRALTEIISTLLAGAKYRLLQA